VRRITIAILIVLLFGHGALADKNKARELTERGIKQYNLGEYATAADAFKAAYDEFPDSTLLYNLAQCERQLSHRSRAITLYKSYLREAPDAPNAAEVRRLIGGLEEDLVREQQTNKPVEKPAVPPPPAIVATPTSAPPAPTRPWWRNPAGWALVGIGVAAAATGGALLGVAAGDQNNAPHAATLGDARTELEQARTFRPAGFALVGVGAATAVAGVIVLAVMPSRWKKRASLVSPMFAFGGSP
jgi:tetratricopeptide (TPR) repeat protein